MCDIKEIRNRNGEFKCLRCGLPHPWKEAHPADTVQRGQRRYICDRCYNLSQNAPVGVNGESKHSPKKHGVSFQLVLNGTPKDPDSRAALDSSLYGLEKAKGTGKSIIWTTPIYQSMNGIKSMLRSFESFSVFGERTQTIRIGIDPDLKFDGRQFSIENGVLEFSCRFQSAKEMFWSVCLAAEIAKTAEVWLPKGKPEIFAGKVEKILAKYERGEALCQRPERNSK